MTMSNFDILKNILDAQQDTGTQAYDTTATVRRIEGSTAWVHIPGGVDETPVRLTINAKAGDTVQLRVGGGSAWLVGNATAPPTDDTVATGAVRQISAVRKVVEKVREVAETASRIAGNTNQYFWHTQEGSDTGAHITEIPREDFLADPTNGGGNTLIRSNGVAVRDGLTELSTFTASGCYLGNEATSRLMLNNVGITGITDTGLETFRIVTGDYRGTQIISETTGIIENTSSNKATMSVGYRSQRIPATHATITFTVNAIVEYLGQTKNKELKVSYQYDPDDPTQDEFHQAFKMIFNREYVTITCQVSYSCDNTAMTFYFSSRSDVQFQNAQISVSMPIPNPVLPSYTFGLRSGTRNDEGAYSFVGGTQNIASGEASSVFGVENVVSGMGSASFGTQNTVTGNYGLASGQGNVVTGDKATALGDHLLAYTSHQTVLGHYNVGDENDEYALIVGNGDLSARSNALTVDWDGNVQAAGQVKSTTETYSLTLPSAVSFGGGLVRNGGVAMLSIINISKLPRGQTTLCTLPEGWRPPISVMNKFEAPDNSLGPVRLFINSSGVVTLYNYGAAITASSNISDTITYVLA